MTRRPLLKTLLLTAGLATGCGDVGSLIYFLTPEQKLPPDIVDIASKDRKHIPKAVILVHGGLETRYEFIDVDKRLGLLLGRQIQGLCKNNDEYLTLIETTKVEAFKSDHSDWAEMKPEEIGRFFKADYVLVIDVNELSLYDRSSPMFYRGKANLSAQVVNVSHPENSPSRADFSYSYPNEAGTIQTDDENMPVPRFRDVFLNHVAKKLACYFAPHPVPQDRMAEE